MAVRVHGELVEREKEVTSQMASDLTLFGQRQGVEELARLLDTQSHPTSPDLFLLARENGSPIAGAKIQWPAEITMPTEWQVTHVFHHGRQRTMGVVAQYMDDDTRLLVGRPIVGAQSNWMIVGSAALISLALGLPLSIIGSRVALKLIDARIDHVNRTVDAVSAGDRHARVAVTGSRDRFDRLGLGINRMLDRTEALVEQLRTLSDSLAHDLRSPITRMTARVDQALRSGEDARTALPDIAAEAQRLLAMLSSVLQISRANAGFGRGQMEPIELQETVEEITTLYEPLVADRGRSLVARTEPTRLLVHRALFGQMLSNLIDNALEHGNGQITIDLVAKTDGVHLLVSDHGFGIPEGLHHVALSRFGRLEDARTEGGFGLGLPLVNAVAKLHGGRLSLERISDGFAVHVVLPWWDHERSGHAAFFE